MPIRIRPCPRHLRCPLPRWIWTSAFVFGALALRAQKTGPALPQNPPNIQPIAASPDSVRDVNAPHNPLNPMADPEMEARLSRIRAKEQQKRIVEDADRLVSLTARYRKALEEHGTRTAEAEKLLLEIEKLAREVEGRMRGM